MANRTGRAQRRRTGSGVRSVAQAEAELSDDVRRRLRATVGATEGWVPGPPENAFDVTASEHLTPELVDAGTVAAGTVAAGTVGAHATSDTAASDATGTNDVRYDAAPPSLGARLRAAFGDRLPLGLRGADVAPSRTAVAGLAGLLAASLAVALFLTWLHRPSESPVPSVRRSLPASAVASLPPTATPAPDVVVHVTGAVRRPGLVDLPGGSRVDDAVSAAGGATRKADLASVNLARVLLDGEQIVVLRKGQATGLVGAPGPPGDSSAAPGQPVDLNTATLEQLDGLPGVGPVLAQRILDCRTTQGSGAIISNSRPVPISTLNRGR